MFIIWCTFLVSGLNLKDFCGNKEQIDIIDIIVGYMKVAPVNRKFYFGHQGE